jgi:hypothetical protein
MIKTFKAFLFSSFLVLFIITIYNVAIAAGMVKWTPLSRQF